LVPTGGDESAFGSGFRESLTRVPPTIVWGGDDVRRDAADVRGNRHRHLDGVSWRARFTRALLVRVVRLGGGGSAGGEAERQRSDGGPHSLRRIDKRKRRTPGP
jgi:hypothetical protein